MAISKSGDRWTVTSQRWFIVLQRGDSFKRSCRLKEIKERVDRSKRFESDPGIEMDPREGEGVKGGGRVEERQLVPIIVASLGSLV